MDVTFKSGNTRTLNPYTTIVADHVDKAAMLQKNAELGKIGEQLHAMHMAVVFAIGDEAAMEEYGGKCYGDALAFDVTETFDVVLEGYGKVLDEYVAGLEEEVDQD